MHRYRCYNAAMATTSAQGKVTTGTATKTMLQVATPATRQCQLLEWGYSADLVSTATGEIELLETNVGATGLTAHLAAGVQPIVPGMPASLMTLGAGATGYAAGAPTEGAITATRLFDAQELIEDTPVANASYTRQWLPYEGPIVDVSKFIRIRATFTIAVNLMVWLAWDE